MRRKGIKTENKRKGRAKVESIAAEKDQIAREEREERRQEANNLRKKKKQKNDNRNKKIEKRHGKQNWIK